uniref:Potassium channel domain-containing protein n=1 Tax=Acrobeloides nanus TaxID=290746 RepID=A0A914C6W4_9BILA
MKVTQCGDGNINSYIITNIDDCYRYAKIDLNSLDDSKALKTYTKPLPTFKSVDEGDIEKDEWNFANAVVFSFTVITTIGYGNIAPVTFEGRLFCIIYGLIGVPLTLMTIADIGMFLNKLVKRLVDYEYNVWGSFKNVIQSRFSTFNKNSDVKSTTPTPRSPIAAHELHSVSEKSKIIEDENKNYEHYDQENESYEESESDISQRRTTEAVTLGVIFLIYIIIGSFVISLYEPDMDLFKAFYFNFVTLTTIGLGDITPRRYKFLVVTFLYITIGLSLTTMVIEIAAEYLKKLHYFGRAIESVSNVEVWFGGRKMKLQGLIRHLGDQFNIPEEELKEFNIDDFVNEAIKVTEGEIKTLRKPKSPLVQLRKESGPLSYRDLRKSLDPSTLQFADEGSILSSDRSIYPPLAQETARTISSKQYY